MTGNTTTIAGDVTRSAVVTGSGNTVILSFGSALSIPIERRQIRPVERRQRGGAVERSELDLLNARTSPVRFFGRERELAELREWLDADTDLSVHALIAPAGTGKTRLAMELCGRVDPADAPGSAGWTAGFLTSDDLPRLADAFSTGTYTWTGNTLLVVDYAGQSVEALRRWLDRLAPSTLAPATLRLLLLERTAPSEIGWWRTLVGVEASEGDAPRRTLFWNRDLRPDDLLGLADVAERRRLFAAVYDAACARAGRPMAMPAAGADPSFDDRLAEARFANPLALVMAGVLASRTTPVEALGLRHLEAAKHIARRELARLRRLLPAADTALVHLVTFGILAGGLPVDGLAKTVAAELASAQLGGDVGDLVEILRQEYPARSTTDGGPQRLTTPEPDLIGEAMVVEARLHGGEDAVSTAALVARAYARGGAAAAAALMRLLQDFAFPREDETASAVEREDAEQLLSWLVRLADACGDAMLAPIVLAIPENTLVLREPALAAAQEAVDLYRALAAERPDAFRPDLAMSLNNLGNRLSDLGRREPALAAAQEAVDLYRALAAERPDAFRPDLASSLNNLGNMLSALGRREPALAAAQEAVDIRRELAAERPDAFAIDLSVSLGSCADILDASGDREVALRCNRDAIDVLRPLFLAQPEATAQWMVMHLQRYFAWSQALGKEPDLEWLAPILAALEKSRPSDSSGK